MGHSPSPAALLPLPALTDCALSNRTSEVTTLKKTGSQSPRLSCMGGQGADFQQQIFGDAASAGTSSCRMCVGGGALTLEQELFHCVGGAVFQKSLPGSLLGNFWRNFAFL